MDTVELIVPRRDLEVSHRAFVEEFRAEAEEPVPGVVGEPLIDAQGEILAVSNLRHALTDYLLTWGGHIGYGVRPGMRRKGHGTEILRQTLLEARALGCGRSD